MKNYIKKAGLTMGLLLLIGQFVSCNKTKKTSAIHKQTSVTINNQSNTEEEAELRKPIVFITGYDKGDNTFYANSRSYFQEKKYQIVEDAYSLEEIIRWMNQNATTKPYGDVHIVSHSNPWKGMSLETVVKGERITTETLRKNITQGTIPKLKNVVSKNTKIIFHSCGLGENTQLMQTLKEAFVADKTPSVIASPYYNVFGGQFSNHYLAQPYYVFYPTAHSTGKLDLSKEIAKKYPEEVDIDWYDALNNEEERYVGEAYTFQFNIPVKWVFDYHNSDNPIPTFTMQEEIMDWIADNEDLAKEMGNYNIPLEKFRWTYSVKNSKLTIKGKTTVLCVLKPLIKPYGDLKHIEPDTNNKRLFAMK